MMKRKRAGRPPAQNHSTLLYLRTANGLSQRVLGEKVGLRAMDISMFEHGRRGIALSKILPLAQHLGVSCSTLLYNNFEEIFARMKKPIETNAAARERHVRRQAGRCKVGYEGEDWVYQLELAKLSGTPYAFAVNPNYSCDDHARFDILSFTTTGEFVHIEVKSTDGSIQEPFYMSAAELAFLEDCIESGNRYELHRVIYAKEPCKRQRIIYTAKEVLENFSYEPNTYLFRLKEAV